MTPADIISRHRNALVAWGAFGVVTLFNGLMIIKATGSAVTDVEVESWVMVLSTMSIIIGVVAIVLTIQAFNMDGYPSDGSAAERVALREATVALNAAAEELSEHSRNLGKGDVPQRD
jgi:NADPH:quinone reductase-like Zn-dependent oxidoreductase